MSATPRRRKSSATSSTSVKPSVKPIGDINVRVRARQALQLLIMGMTYDQIAHAVGLSHKGAAYKLCQRELQRYQSPVVEEARSIELARLDALLQTWMPRALGKQADRSAAEVVLKVAARRAALLGLDFTAQDRQAADQQRMYLVSVPDALMSDPLPPMPNGVPQPRANDSIYVVSQTVLDAIG